MYAFKKFRIFSIVFVSHIVAFLTLFSWVFLPVFLVAGIATAYLMKTTRRLSAQVGPSPVKLKCPATIFRG